MNLQAPTVEAQKQELAAALRLAAHFGLNEGVCNHFSLQLADDSFLLNPHGIYWSEICASDIITVGAGTSQEAETTALNIHGAIHRQLPNAKCVLHTHMPFATTLTCLVDNNLKFIHQNSLRFYDDVSYDNDYGGLAESIEEGERIARQMDKNRVLFMANHGVIVTGQNVAEAFDRLYYLERACEIQVKALSTGQPIREIGTNIAMKTRREFDSSADYSQQHFDGLKAILSEDYLS